MRHKKFKILIFIIIAIAATLFIKSRLKPVISENETVKEVKPIHGAIQSIISTTGTVLPKNRLELKPPVNGRVEEMLVHEGDEVKIGQTLAQLSSTERAALLDAARGKGEKTLEYWKEVYKAIPLIAPINGQVIVATTQPGQTVTTGDPVLVLSDRLIVRAQVDETDIGKIKPEQSAVVILDAYPDIKMGAKVDHIYYESKTVNNVTIYEVDLVPDAIPDFCRSGMNATVNFIESNKEDTLLIPSEAALRESGATYVLIKEDDGKNYVKRYIKAGLADNKNIEVISGINADDIVIIRSKKYVLPKSDTTRNPFMPSRPAEQKKAGQADIKSK